MKYLSLIFISALVLSLAVIGCDDDDDNPTQPSPQDTLIDKKPNIYLYPAADARVDIKIIFPQWGKVIESTPEYGNGWSVDVTKDGKINNSYSYIYYECEIPDFAQMEYGWVVKQSGLEEFFKSNLSASGFNEIETKDFTDYWIPRLNKSEYYEVYPQYLANLEKAFALDITPKPDNVYRLSYLLKGRNDDTTILKEPVLQKANREGFYVMEWGVILK
ncbi:MAG TPA: hypothetical protein VHO28_15425 [Ignavibacteriales bacterium]|nr:hypothetical protein [Ignavibacteriales bacterium]